MPLMFTTFEILDMLGKEAGSENRLDEWLWDEDYEDTYDAVLEAWEKEHGKVSD